MVVLVGAGLKVALSRCWLNGGFDGCWFNSGVDRCWFNGGVDRCWFAHGEDELRKPNSVAYMMSGTLPAPLTAPNAPTACVCLCVCVM